MGLADEQPMAKDSVYADARECVEERLGLPARNSAMEIYNNNVR
jgi:hypothetical protein